MPISDWCNLARTEYEKKCSDNHVFLNWLASNKQGILSEKSKKLIAQYMLPKATKFMEPNNNDSSYDWLRGASNDLEKNEGVDVRTMGPVIDGDFGTQVFANISRLNDESEGLIDGNVDQVANTHRSELPDRSHDYYDENQIKWLVPADKLLAAIDTVSDEQLVPTAAKVLGLNNSSFSCVIHFYRLLENGNLHRPTIFSDCDELRWACIENVAGFGTTLDAVNGEKRLPEAVTKRHNLTKLNPYQGIAELDENACFRRLLAIGFKGFVSETENPTLDEGSEFANSFRETAQWNILESNGGFVSCLGYCQDGGTGILAKSED